MRFRPLASSPGTGLLIMLPLLAVLGCKATGNGARLAEASGPNANLTDMVSAHCSGCHTSDKGMPAARQALQLDTLQDVLDNRDNIDFAVASSKQMPPFHVNPTDAADYDYDYGFAAGEREQFMAAVNALQEGGDLRAPIPYQPAGTGPNFTDPVSTYDTAALVANYRPVQADMVGPNDAYRCFVVYADDPALSGLLANRSFITGFKIRTNDPASSPIHHMLVHIAAPEIAQAMKQTVNASNGFSYSCYGAVLPEALSKPYLPSALKVYRYQGTPPGPQNPRPGLLDTGNALALRALFTKAPLVNTYEPSNKGLAFPQGSGIPVPPGSALIMQIHYNVPDPKNFKDPGLTIQIAHADKVQKLAMYRFLTNQRQFYDKELRAVGATPVIELPPGSTKQVTIGLPKQDVFTTTQTVLQNFGVMSPGQQITGLNIYGFNPHMHGTGLTYQVNVKSQPKSNVLQVDHFYQSWQRDYLLKTSIHLDAQTYRDGALEIVCGYKNFRNNVIYGGFGNGDEMCLLSMLVTVDVTGGNTP